MPVDRIISFWAPDIDKKGRKIPNYQTPKNMVYVIETIITNGEAIMEYLQNNKQGLDFYADYFKNLFWEEQKRNLFFRKRSLGLICKS